MVQINAEQEEKYTTEQLLEIMRALRAPGGCPWDKEQTHKSIRKDLLEEAYEVAEAIDKSDDKALCEELGDLLLQVVFHSAIAEEEKAFLYSDVVDGICRKLILRHPHVFGKERAENSAEVLDLWDKVKMVEKHQESFTETLKSVPEAFPALMRSAKVQKRAAKAGLETDCSAERIKQLAHLLCEAESRGDKPLQTELYSKILFCAAGMQRHLSVDAEEALNAQTNLFIEQFERAEAEAKQEGISVCEAYNDCSLSKR